VTQELSGLYPLKYEGEYASLKFIRSGAQIIDFAAKRCAALQKKIEQIESSFVNLDKEILLAQEQECRTRATRGAYESDVYRSNRYSESAKLMNRKETAKGDQDKAKLEIAKLTLIAKSLSTDQVFSLEFAELVYFEGPWNL
jgi:hypothetical protein